jgi:O-acetyl-ADP-ribose deacetylase (regulator of RNase III)
VNQTGEITANIGGKALRLEQKDITRVEVDAIVNAANSQLAGGGGVDGAIHRAAGPSVMKELDEIRKKLGRCEPGNAVVTGAGKLRASYIFHAVGPVYRGGGEGEAETLASCYRVCLRMAAERELKSVAFPAISTGIYGYPLDEAASIAIQEISKFLKEASSVEEVRMVLFGQEAFDAFQNALRRSAGGSHAA